MGKRVGTRRKGEAAMTTKQVVWSVWVDGAEVNDHYLTRREAQDLADEFMGEGFKDVVIRKEAQDA